MFVLQTENDDDVSDSILEDSHWDLFGDIYDGFDFSDVENDPPYDKNETEISEGGTVDTMDSVDTGDDTGDDKYYDARDEGEDTVNDNTGGDDYYDARDDENVLFGSSDSSSDSAYLNKRDQVCVAYCLCDNLVYHVLHPTDSHSHIPLI